MIFTAAPTAIFVPQKDMANESNRKIKKSKCRLCRLAALEVSATPTTVKMRKHTKENVKHFFLFRKWSSQAHLRKRFLKLAVLNHDNFDSPGIRGCF